jgi:hypothetical protein
MSYNNHIFINMSNKANNQQNYYYCSVCNQEQKIVAPLVIENVPYVSQLNYRVGTYSSFMNSMVAAISRPRYFKGYVRQGEHHHPKGITNHYSLTRLTTRANDDLIIALIDAWSTVSDVITFYQERIANEGFLRTATERESLVQLSHGVGYELNPGLAASAYLAFTIEDTPAGTEQQKTVNIAKGTRVQSLPAPGEAPQVFETIENIDARLEWNELKPKLTKKQSVDKLNSTFYFDVRDIQLKPGDKLVFLQYKDGVSEHFVKTVQCAKLIDAKSKITQVDVINDDEIAQKTEGKQQQDSSSITAIARTTESRSLAESTFSDVLRQIASLSRTSRKGSLMQDADYDEYYQNAKKLQDQAKIREKYYPMVATDEDLFNEAIIKRIHPSSFFKALNYHMKKKIASQVEAYNKVFYFNINAGLYGHNAPRWDSLPDQVTSKIPAQNKDWDDNFMTIGKYSKHIDEDNKIYLDGNYPSILPGSLILLKSKRESYLFSVLETNEKTMTDFLLNLKVTGISLAPLNSSENFDWGNDKHNPIYDFGLRETTVYVQSKELNIIPEILLDETDSSSLGDDYIILGIQEDASGLEVGKTMAITGQDRRNNVNRGDIVCLKSKEPVYIDDERPDGKPEKIDDAIRYSKLVFQNTDGSVLDFKICDKYKQSSLKLNANVALATQGETKEEILGSGDPSQANQKFILKQKPLTFVSSSARLSSSRKGSLPALTITVDNVYWHQTDNFHKMKQNDHAYKIQEEDDATTYVIFGDGVNGARLPAGIQNVKAKYRIGMGSKGNDVKINQLTLLMNKPLGVKSVTNPVSPSGGEDAENIIQARLHISNSLLTMDRIVSVVDFQNFALAFAGIGKARATVVSKGNRKTVSLIIGSSSGEPIEVYTDLYINLKKAIEDHKDPLIPFYMYTFSPRYFGVKMNVMCDSDLDPTIMKKEIESVLHDMFSYNSRGFGQAVTKSDIIVAVQRIDGIVMVDLERMYKIEPEKNPFNANNNDRISRIEDADSISCSIDDILMIHPLDGPSWVDVSVSCQP